MGYIPIFVYLDHFIDVTYPFGAYWEHSYIQQCAEIIFNTYKEDIDGGTSITFVVRGTSGAMIAGAILNQLNNINPTTKTYILIVRKEEDISGHCPSLRGIEETNDTRFVVVDDFIASGNTIEAIIRALDLPFMGVVCPSMRTLSFSPQTLDKYMRYPQDILLFSANELQVFPSHSLQPTY